MYRIIKQDGTEIAVTEKIHYIKIAKNGCYVLTEKEDAEGVAVDGIPYSILMHEPLTGAEDTVVISEFDSGTEFSYQLNTIKDATIQLEQALLDNGDITIDVVPEEWWDSIVTDTDKKVLEPDEDLPIGDEENLDDSSDTDIE